MISRHMASTIAVSDPGFKGTHSVDLGGRVRQTRIKSNEFHPTIGHGRYQPLGTRNVVGVGVHDAATEIDHELGVVEIPVVVMLAPGQLLAGPLGTFTAGGCFHSAVVEHELFRVAFITQFFQAA